MYTIFSYIQYASYCEMWRKWSEGSEVIMQKDGWWLEAVNEEKECKKIMTAKQGRKVVQWAKLKQNWNFTYPQQGKESWQNLLKILSTDIFLPKRDNWRETVIGLPVKENAEEALISTCFPLQLYKFRPFSPLKTLWA